MKLEDRILEIIKSRKSDWHKPKVGVYHASRIYDIAEGKVSPKDFMTPPEFDDTTLQIFEIGTMYHEYVQKLLGMESEIPWEVDCGGFKITGRADGKINGHFIELKTCSRMPEEPKPEHIYQIQCNLEGLGADTMFLTYIEKNPRQFLTRTFQVERDTKLINEIIEKVGVFHKKLSDYTRTEGGGV